VYRAWVPSSVKDVVRRRIIRPVQRAQEIFERELARHFPESAEPHLDAVLRRYLHPGDTFVDVGANFGGLAVRAARLVAASGRVVCFEPVPSNFARLTRNLSRRAAGGQVIVEQRAVGDARGTVEMFLNFWDGLHTTDPVVNRGARVGSFKTEQVTLDEAMDYHRVRDIALLKVDVEGAELRVLAGARGLLAAGRVAAVVLEVCNPEEPGKADNARQVDDLMRDARFDGQLVTPAGLTPWDHRACRTRQDVLFTRRAA
jgi:FkbM family methyltransferase